MTDFNRYFRKIGEIDQFHSGHADRFPQQAGMRLLTVEAGRVSGTLEVGPALIAPNGHLYAAAMVMLADVCAGYGALAHLPEGARGFATIELKSNFVGTVADGAIHCEAQAVHLGRRTQIWDAEVTGPDGVLALFRCTQMVLH